MNNIEKLISKLEYEREFMEKYTEKENPYHNGLRVGFDNAYYIIKEFLTERSDINDA